MVLRKEPKMSFKTYYPGGKSKALTLSYDDGQIFDRRLVEIFNKYNMKGTFHLNSGTLGKDGYVTQEEVKEQQKQTLGLSRLPSCWVLAIRMQDKASRISRKH